MRFGDRAASASPVLLIAAVILLAIFSIPNSVTGQTDLARKSLTPPENVRILHAIWWQFVSPGNAKCTGINVYAAGHFHLERLYVSFPFGQQVDVYEGPLSEPKMSDLRLIVSDPGFATLHISPRIGRIESDGQSLAAEVRRENEIQRFAIINDGKSEFPAAALPFIKWIDGLKPEKSLRMKKAEPELCVVAGSLP